MLLSLLLVSSFSALYAGPALLIKGIFDMWDACRCIAILEV